MMKKLLLFCFIALSTISCNKEDTSQHCWMCRWSKVYTDKNPNNAPYSSIDSIKLCDMTEKEIRENENRYKATKRLDTTYGDRVCEQLPDKE